VKFVPPAGFSGAGEGLFEHWQDTTGLSGLVGVGYGGTSIGFIMLGFESLVRFISGRSNGHVRL